MTADTREDAGDVLEDRGDELQDDQEDDAEDDFEKSIRDMKKEREDSEDAVPRRVHLLPSSVLEYHADDRVVSLKQLRPSFIAERRR